MIDNIYLDLRINQELDRQLVDCPVCHAKYNDPHKGRRGPTCINKFEGNKLHIICLNCWTVGKAFKTQQEAIDNWNNGELSVAVAAVEPNLDLIAKRKESGLSQLKMAEKIGVAESTIWRWENGTSVPIPENKVKLEKLLVSIERNK